MVKEEIIFLNRHVRIDSIDHFRRNLMTISPEADDILLMRLVPLKKTDWFLSDYIYINTDSEQRRTSGARRVDAI